MATDTGPFDRTKPYAHVFKIVPNEGFADRVVGMWQVDIFPDSVNPAVDGVAFATFPEAVQAAQDMVRNERLLFA